jgi:hydrogenase/urease accessory protein HupE
MTKAKTQAPWLLAAAALAFVALFAFPCRRAFAHAVGLSRGAYTVDMTGVRAVLTFERSDAIALAPALDSNQSGLITPANLEAARSDLERAVLGELHVDEGGVRCAPRLVDVQLTEQDGLEISGRYDCPRRAKSAHVSLAFLGSLGAGHRHLVHATGAVTLDEVCFRGQDTFDVPVPGAGTGGETSSDETRPARGWRSFLWMGVEHILTGYDHLVFLFGLVLVGGRLRAIIAVVTAFTIAHSITLAMATLDVWAPSARIVEPAIALSIAYVGVENFFVKTAEGRWRITFPFGLIHGFGFAGALKEIGLPHAQLPQALVLFNVGVEMGQLGVLALILPILYGLRRRAWFRDGAVKVLSVGVTLAGVVWFFERFRG